MPSAQEFDKAADEQLEARLALARAKADAARRRAAEEQALLRLEEKLVAAERRERALFHREEQSVVEMDKLEKESNSSESGKNTESTGATVLSGPSLSEPFAADLGWLQTDENVASSSSFDLDAFLHDFSPLPLDSVGDRRSPVPCSS
jgi:hypothetical protein